jgi:hypothetical protein
MRIVRSIMLKGAMLAELQFDMLALGGLMALAMIIAVSRFRRTLEGAGLVECRAFVGWAKARSAVPTCGLAVPRGLRCAQPTLRADFG